MNYSKEQIKAIKHREGPAIVIAGPGSGKTAVLIERINFLISRHSIEPDRILVITFSKAAASELQNRFSMKCSGIFAPVTFGTFHSVFFHILHQELQFNITNIATSMDKRMMLRRTLKMLDIAESAENELLDNILKAISFYKNGALKKLPALDCNITSKQFIDIYAYYDEAMRSNGKIDFEDMLLLTYNLISENEAIKQKYANKWQYIMIDEFQDINPIQFETIRLLAKNSNLWICGDDDQSLYKFRFGSPELMINFKKYYPDANSYYLSTNYRSSNEIIQAANRVISENKTRISKNIIGTGRQGNNVRIMSHDTAEHENEWIVNLINEFIENNTINDSAILCRTNLEATLLSQYISASGYSCENPNPDNNQFQRKVLFDFMHYIKLADNNPILYAEHLLPVMNKPVRFFNRKYLGKKRITMDEIRDIYSKRGYMRAVIDNFEYQLNKINSMEDLYSKINYIRKGIGYDEYVREQNLGNLDVYEDYLRIADSLQFISRNYDSIDEMVDAFEDLAHYKKPLTGNTSDSVRIMTFHSSKGLEFRNVIIPHVNEGTVPHRKSIGEEAVEEERRMFYVAMTRAKDNLYISFVDGKKKRKSMPSRFLYSLLKYNST